MNTYLVYYCDGKYNGCVAEMEPECEESHGDSKAQVLWGHLKTKTQFGIKELEYIYLLLSNTNPVGVTGCSVAAERF